MLKYQNLRFFDGNSGELDFYYDEESQYWSGTVYMPKVSTGLYETANLFIFEEVITDSGNIEYVKPISESAGEVTFRFEFIDQENSSDSIFIYDTKINKSGNYEIDVKSTIELGLQGISINQSITTYQESNSSVGNITKSIEYKTIGDSFDKNAIHCNIAINSEREDLHIRLLNIYEIVDGVQSSPVAAIQFYGETVEEDERLVTLLSNIGLSINEEDGLIFKDTNVNELATDWQIINNKRKELLLEAHNIAPFIGTYKAILNAIKFYGYDNLTLKEYWLNINEQSSNFGKLLAVAVPNQNEKGFLIDKASKIELPNSNHKKTSRFSLHYRINEPTNTFDEYDIPLTEEVSNFSPDEILIKLYGLKRKLQKEYLPLQAKIVDITGDADYFTQFKQRIWNNQQTIKVQNSGVEVDFMIWPERPLFIEDLRKVDPIFKENTSDYTTLTNPVNITNFYDTYYNNDIDTYPELGYTPIGCPIILKGTSLKDTWDDCDFTWDDAHSGSNDYTGIDASLLTWQNWWYRGVYEIEWVITGPNDYTFIKRDLIQNIYEYAHVLPYTGEYSVTLNMYDLYNARSYRTKANIINVKSKEVDVYGIYEYKEDTVIWNNYNTTYDKAGATFDLLQENKTEIQDLDASWYLTLDRSNYISNETTEIPKQFSTVRRYVDSNSPDGFAETTGPYVWNYLKEHTWNDGAHVTWDMTRVGADLNASFLIDVREDQLYVNGTPLIIEYTNQLTKVTYTESYVIQSSYPVDNTDLVAWQAIADELNGLNSNDYPILKKFIYNPVYKDADKNQTIDTCNFILATASEYSSSYDFDDVYFEDINGGNVYSKIHYKGYNPTYNDVRIIRSHENIDLLNHVTFSFDRTKMPGVITQQWKLKNNSRNENDIYYNNQWLTYLFPHRGDYTLELELTDCNGNRNNIKRNILTIK